MISSQIVILGVILSVAFMTQAERKIMGAMQRRVGPNKIGYQGIQQPFADGIKQIQKETIQPQSADTHLFQGAPFITFFQALLNWQVLPQDYGIVQSEIMGGGMQVQVAIAEQGIYGVQYAGWAANSKYPFQGSLRSTAQMISYSVSQSQIIQTVQYILGTINLLDIQHGQYVIATGWVQLPMVLLFMISAIAETNRAPADQPEAESEQVAGFMTEHSAISFAYFFLGEYTSILTISTLFFILFFGISMALPFIFFLIWIRASLARLRFDQQLTLGWSNILPFTISVTMWIPPFIYTFAI